VLALAMTIGYCPCGEYLHGERCPKHGPMYQMAEGRARALAAEYHPNRPAKTLYTSDAVPLEPPSRP
jgi:hypothetical protein